MEQMNDMSFLIPSFVKKISDPAVKTVLLCGCGGGFDFVHSMNLYPELRRLNKTVIIVSYSFGNVDHIGGVAPVIWNKSGVKVKTVTAASRPEPHYAPEIHMCSFLDLKYPQSAPHQIYACNAREFTVPLLTEFYSKVVNEHSVDGIIIFDGGSDSLMRGDEESLGDPIEDCVSVTTVSLLKEELKFRILITAGFGADRFNHVSDASSLRAVAELTQMGGFLGSLSLEPSHPGFQFYTACVQHIYSRQSFRSVLTGLVISATQGYFAHNIPDDSNSTDAVAVKVDLRSRIGTGESSTVFLWPLMAMLFAFDAGVVCKRSYLASWIKDAETVNKCYDAMREGRNALKNQGKLRRIENLPTHEEMRS